MPSIVIDNAVMMHDLDPNSVKAFLHEFAEASTFHGHHLSALRKAVAAEDVVEELKHHEWLLTDPRSALVSVISVNAKLPPKRRVTLKKAS